MSSIALALRAALSASIPTKTLGDSLLVASWNIRDFGKGKHGGRSAEALTYIAEILSRFDIVAVQEVSADLADLECVRRKLGGWWSCLYTDVTEGVAGNGERLAFLFDSRTVRMSGLAGEIVLPGKKKQPVLQFARPGRSCATQVSASIHPAHWLRCGMTTMSRSAVIDASVIILLLAEEPEGSRVLLSRVQRDLVPDPRGEAGPDRPHHRAPGGFPQRSPPARPLPAGLADGGARGPRGSAARGRHAPRADRDPGPDSGIGAHVSATVETENPRFGRTAGMSLCLVREHRGRGLLRPIYRALLDRMRARGATAFKGGTSQRGVMHLGFEMGREMQGVCLRRGAYFDEAHFARWMPL